MIRIRWVMAGALLLSTLMLMGCGAGKQDAAQTLAKQLQESWQQVECAVRSREDCESAFSDVTIGSQNISLPESGQYHLITCKNPGSGDENITILADGTGKSLSEFVEGMGFRGYNVGYQASTESAEKSVYQWRAETRQKTCVITITASGGPLKIQVEVRTA